MPRRRQASGHHHYRYPIHPGLRQHGRASLEP
jgi:hypothetical protein